MKTVWAIIEYKGWGLGLVLKLKLGLGLGSGWGWGWVGVGSGGISGVAFWWNTHTRWKDFVVKVLLVDKLVRSSLNK